MRFLSVWIRYERETSSNDEISVIIILREFAEAQGVPSKHLAHQVYLSRLYASIREKFPVSWRVIFVSDVSNFRIWPFEFFFLFFIFFLHPEIIFHKILFAVRKKKKIRRNKIWRKKNITYLFIGYNYHFFVLYVYIEDINKVYLTWFENFEIIYIYI